MFDIISCGHFNPRSREGSDLNAAVKSSGSNFNFNPRSREGSDLDKVREAGKCDISIHAPAKGATEIVWHVILVITISIHAPAKGATSMNSLVIVIM